ncbi:zonadhesin-like isoform X2 [Sebastes umbrosus]|uniref:zonadhesin-like isoform X2 n=1 Tax=Sebastes umbrosus TaxID=72105 RepID=UPI0018A02710|nr:zonadhesin-like isoform X2 [Sebastes umbrosus]
MLGGIHTDLLVTVTLLFVTLTGTQCRAENDFSLVTLPDWRPNSEYVTQCFYDGHNNLICDWTQQRTEDDVETILESGPLGPEGEACLEFWYLAPVAANGSELGVLLNSSVGLTEIWTVPALPSNAWRQVFVPLNIIEPGTQVVVKAVSMDGQFNQIGVRRGSCGAQCESDTEFWTDESTRCFCSGGQLSCSPAQCPEGQICGPQTGNSSGTSASGMCTIHSHTDCSTFDGVLFRFMAPCTYTLAKTCSPSEALPMFSVEVVNEQNWNSSLPTVKQVNVNVGNFRLSLLKRQTHRVVVNGVWKKLPLRLGSGMINIKSNPAAVELGTSFGLSVSYDNAGAVHVALPSTYSDEVCGLCGNFNHLREDDFRKPDGTNAQDATALAESWQTGQTTSSCETILVPHQCDPLEMAEYASELHCGGLLSVTGPFAGCLAVLGAESYFRGCVVGMCATHGDPEVLCETLQVYTDICQEAGVIIPLWRNSTFCPLQCPENSHYNSCADGCPEVCSSLDIVGSCESCEERCECNSGLKLSGGKCVPAEDCGCWYNGNHYENGATFSEGECEQQCQCMGNDNVQCTAMQCVDNEVCKVKDGVKGCFPFKPATCSVYGDPHYITFDGMAYNFQGGCSYTLTTTCGEESSVQFTVIGHNTHPPDQNFTRSKLDAVTLQVDDLYVTLNQSGEVYVNSSRVKLPFSTSDAYGSVWVNLKKNYIILETTFGLRMMIDAQNRLFLQVDERYKYELCGLCGTYSERQDDDFVTPGGQNSTGPFEFGDSWKVPGNNECVSHPNDPRLCDYDEENEAYNECDTLLRDVFKPCHEPVHPSIYLSSCVYDYCATSGDQHTQCESLKSYAAACQVAGVELPHWQTDTACVCPINCDFENNLCGWEQLVQDSFDWTRHSGPTPSSSTGPNQDHTTGAGFYMYIEGDSVTHGDSARLWSSMCHYNGPLCLHFWYHVYGSATAMALNIYLLKDNKVTKLWSMMNNQGPEWHPGNVDIKVTGPFQIIVEGIRGSNAQSDVAIDDISIHFGSCSGSFPDLASGTVPPSITTEVVPSHPVCKMDCSFNSNLCSWNQMITDAFDWTWQSGSTPTLMTGPSADHTGDGHYLYIEASSVTYGDTARLISSECSDSGPQCLQFWYHMYGSADTMGLHVYLLQEGLADAVFWKRNDQGNMWHLAQVDITTTGAFQIIIEGRRGSNEESDVAIDDVKLYHGQCSDQSGVVATNPPKPGGNTARPSVPVPTAVAPEPPLVNVTAQPPVPNITTPPVVEATTNFINKDNVTEALDNIPPSHSVCQLNCNFGQDLCQWSQPLTDAFDWTRHSGSTPTMMTGPSSDHTTGDGHYLYIEANSASYGDTARLISSECSDSGPQCLQFWYHMYGSADTMGLHVYLLQDRLADAVLWKRNDQGNMWHLAQVDLTTSGTFQIIFEGRRGSNDQSDVAIDDVSLHRGHCTVTDVAGPTIPAPTTFNPELPPANSSTATQPQTSTSSKPQPPSTTPSTTTMTATTAAATTVTPKTPITTGPPTTARPYPPTTEHPGVETTEEGQTTARPEQPATPNKPPTTTRPQPHTTESHEPTAGSQTTQTAGPQPTTAAGPRPTTTAGPQPTTVAGPRPTTTAGPQSTTAAGPRPTTTAGPQSTTAAGPRPTTTAGPQSTTAAGPRPTTTAGPQSTTAAGPRPTTTAGPRPTTTAGSRPTTTAGPRPTTTAGSQPTTAAGPRPTTTAGPQSTTAAGPRPTTTAGPQPTTAAGPRPTTAAGPQPTTAAGSQPTTAAGPRPTTTAGPQPTTAAGPRPTTTAGPQSTTAAGPRPTTTAGPQPTTAAGPRPTTAAGPQPTTAAGPRPTTAAGPQPTTAAGPRPTTTAGPQPTTAAGPRPTTTAGPKPTTTAGPQPTTTAGPQPTTTIKPHSTTGRPQPTTTATPQPPTTRVPTPSCPENSHYTTCVPACSPTCSNLNGLPRCGDSVGCEAGCVCDEGFVKKRRSCVPIQHCGCVDRNGTKHSFNEEWYTDHCSQKCECEKDNGAGKIDCDDQDECDGNAVCLQNQEGDYYCQSTGFDECTISEDPEYRTFDKMKHDFEGEHSYVLVRTNNLPNNIPPVYIEGINSVHDDSSSEEDRRDSEEDDDDEDDDSEHDDDSDEDKKHYHLKMLKIRVYNHTLLFKKNQKLLVDGKKTDTPASPTAGLKIWEHSSRIYLKTDFGLSVEFDGHGNAEIILPRIYKRKVGGLCGNFDGQRKNDWMKPDGSRARDVQEFGDSWRV